MSRKEAGIKRIGLRIRAECDERMGPQFLQRDGMVQQVPEGRRTDGNLLDLPDVCLLKGRRVQNRRRDNSKICSRLSQSGDSLRGRMIADAQAHARILGAECLEHRQEHAAQRALACSKKHRTGLQRTALREFRFPGFQLFYCNFDMPVEPFALRR